MKCTMHISLSNNLKLNLKNYVAWEKIKKKINSKLIIITKSYNLINIINQINY